MEEDRAKKVSLEPDCKLDKKSLNFILLAMVE